MKTVLVAGASGYLGGCAAREFKSQGWRVRALARSADKLAGLAGAVDEKFIGQATQPRTLRGVAEGVNVVFSSLGITRQRDGLGYMDVDFQANLNLLDQARSEGAGKFIYVSVLDADQMPELKLIKAKLAFEDKLKASGLDYVIIRPNGFFSDMTELLDMARRGRVWLFGDGRFKGNPIHGRDLARACVEAADDHRRLISPGGPDLLTHRRMAELAFEALDKPPRISLVPLWVRNAALTTVRRLTPVRVHGPLEFFMTVMARDMIGEPYGEIHLADFYRDLVRTQGAGGEGA